MTAAKVRVDGVAHWNVDCDARRSREKLLDVNLDCGTLREQRWVTAASVANDREVDFVASRSQLWSRLAVR